MVALFSAASLLADSGLFEAAGDCQLLAQLCCQTGRRVPRLLIRQKLVSNSCFVQFSTEAAHLGQRFRLEQARLKGLHTVPCVSCRTEGFCRSAHVCRILLDEVIDRRCRSTKQLTQHDGFVCRFCRVTASVRSVSKKRQATMPVRQSESSDSRPSDANFGFRKKRRQTSRRRHCSEGKAAKVQTPRFIPCLDLRMRCPRDKLQTGRE